MLASANKNTSSGQGVNPYRRYGLHGRARERLPIPAFGFGKVSRSGEMPGPTVTVRMREDVMISRRRDTACMRVVVVLP